MRQIWPRSETMLFFRFTHPSQHTGVTCMPLTWSISWGFSTNISLKPPWLLKYDPMLKRQFNVQTRYVHQKKITSFAVTICFVQSSHLQPLPAWVLFRESFLWISLNTFSIRHTNSVIQPSMRLVLSNFGWNYTGIYLYLGATAINFFSTRKIMQLKKHGVCQMNEQSSLHCFLTPTANSSTL